MSTYVVIKAFKDSEDNNKHIYQVGDVFPHDGRKITEERLEALTTNKNKINTLVIVEAVDEDEIPDGALLIDEDGNETIKGKEEPSAEALTDKESPTEVPEEPPKEDVKVTKGKAKASKSD
jgi:hypothetical protein